jgi:flagellar hook-associated protein 2
MGTIASAGAGSGLDVQGIVQKLVEAEGTPKIVRLNTEEAAAQAKLSALGTLRSALASFRSVVGVLKDIEKFQGRQVTTSSAKFFSATATSTAVPGSYSVEVDHLAQAQKSQSGDYLAVTDVVGTGTLTIEAGDDTFEITVDGTNNTLAGVAKAINASAAHDKVFATVVSGATKAVLTISARATGAANDFTVAQTGGDVDFTAFVAGITPVQDAVDSLALVDGVQVTSATNTLSDAITGVNLQLLAANEDDETTNLAIDFNRTAARKAVDDFVKSYNSVVDAIKAVASYNTETRQGGPLFSDAGVRNIVYQLRRELSATVGGIAGSFDMLNEIGISAQIDGKLAVDSTKLDAAFTSDFDGIGALFATKDAGIAAKVDLLLDPYLKADGVFDARTKSLKSSIEDIGDRREVLNQKLEALQARYLKQFNALDQLLAKMQGTSNFLTQQLARLPEITINKRR